MAEPGLSEHEPVPTTCLPRGSAVLDRLMFKTALLSNGCWEWRGARNPKGYGNIRVESYGPAKSTHRVAYTFMVGAIPDGMEIDHLCRNRACVNPEHLEPVDHTTNVRRSEHPLKTHCNYGHAIDAIQASGRRRCRTCQRDAMRKHRAKERAA